jgi:MFS family permease
LAIPIVAAITLDASPLEMGVIAAFGSVPFLIFSLIAGVVADRSRRRPILIWTDIGRAVLLTLIPAAWWLDLLSIPLLIAVAFLSGTLSVFFEVAYQSYLPSVVSRDELVEGNSKLETSRGGAQVLGPGLAGGLIEILGAPVAIVFDAASFLISGLLLGSIRKPEAPFEELEKRDSLRREIAEGVSFISRHPVLRPIAGCAGTANFFAGMSVAVYVLFATTTLEISAGLLGVIFGAGGVGFLLGAVVSNRASDRLGTGPAMIAGHLLASFGFLVVPFVGGSPLIAGSVLFAGSLITGIGLAFYNITQVSLRQAITPSRLLGRMNATMRFLVLGSVPVGNLSGGVLAQAVGLRATLAVAGVGFLLAVLWPVFSDLRSVHTYAEQAVVPAPAEAR